MTDLDLTAIKKRAEAATPGPWWAWDRGVGWVIGLGDGRDERGRPEDRLPEGFRTDIGRAEDAEFIAAARTDIPALVAELERMQRLLDVPSVDSYESMAQALADERAEVVRHCDRIAELTALLAEILGNFPEIPPNGFPGRSHLVAPETLDRWRSRLERAS